MGILSLKLTCNDRDACSGRSPEIRKMEEKMKNLRTIVHQLSNDFSGVKALVDLHAMGLKPELDMKRIKEGLDRVNESLSKLKDTLRSE